MVETMRLIDADYLKEKGNYDDYDVFVVDYDDIKNAPTIDPVRHGRWDLIDAREPVRYGCSVCHRMVWHHENYCPNCGAKMDEEE